MELKEFSIKLKALAEKINVELTENNIENFYKYMNLLIDWNKKINLTAIIEPNDIILKHFIDCLVIDKYIKNDSTIIDVGTGAGFPGVPLSFVNEKSNFTLMDSLNKRIKFLDEVVHITNSKNIKNIHARAEELAKNKDYREKFDFATSRAVASLNVLLEYLLPLVKVGGIVIAYKGGNVGEEFAEAHTALEVLGGKVIKSIRFDLPNNYGERNIVIIEKVKPTPAEYPRSRNLPKIKPIV